MKCQDCNQEMSDDTTTTCTIKTIILDDEKEYNRDTQYFDQNDRCHDCNIKNELYNIHHLGCDMERCPQCGGQLISCDHFNQ